MISAMFRSTRIGRPTGWSGVKCQLMMSWGRNYGRFHLSLLPWIFQRYSDEHAFFFFFYNTNLKFLKGKSECGALVGWGGLRGWHNQQLEVAQPLLGWNPA